MLELVAAAILSQTPLKLQALVPTSGSGAENLLDGKPTTTWSPEGDAEGEGVLFRFEGDVKLTQVSVQACAGKKATLIPYVNGTVGAQVTVNDALTPVSTSSAHRVRSVFLKFADALGSCLSEVRFVGEKPLDVRAPRRLDATAKASSVLAPADAYHPGYLFDGRPDFGWVEGVKGPGLGESMTLTFTAPVTLTALELWNGYQRSADHFAKNARAKKVALSLDGAAPLELSVKDVQGPQKLMLPKPTSATTLTLTIKQAYPGSKYDDLVLSELRVWDEQGPRSIATSDLQDRAATLKTELATTPLATFIDHNLRGVCHLIGYEFEAKFRSNHSFVVYRSSRTETDDAPVDVSEVIDGTWIAKDGKTIELFGRAHRNETGAGPYEDVVEPKDTTTITGGPVTITRVSDLTKDAYLALLSKFSTGPLRWSFACAEARQYEELAKKNAFVLEGRAVTAILAP